MTQDETRAALIEIVRRARLYKKVGPAGSGILMSQLMQVQVEFSMSSEEVIAELLAALSTPDLPQALPSTPQEPPA